MRLRRSQPAPLPELAHCLKEHFTTPVIPRYGGQELDPPKRLVYLLDYEYTVRDRVPLDLWPMSAEVWVGLIVCPSIKRLRPFLLLRPDGNSCPVKPQALKHILIMVMAWRSCPD
jgi:hypothetical protein